MLRITHLLPKLLLLSIACAGILMFLLPMTVRIVNAGNLFGLLGSVLLLCFAVWNRPFCNLLDKIRQHTAGRILTNTIGVLIAAGLLLCLVLSVLMVRAAQKKPQETPQAVVVLGCKVRGTVPSLMLSRRIQAAYEALQQYPEMIAVVSGGKGAQEDISEAACIAQELIARGISADRILLEDQSTSTSENLRFSGEILRQLGIDTPVLLATDGYHQLRAAYLAELEGVRVCGAVSAATSWYLVPTYWVREWFGLVHAFVFGD